MTTHIEAPGAGLPHRIRAQEAHAERVQDLAWALARQWRTDGAEADDRTLRAVEIALDVHALEEPNTAIRAHRALARAIETDIRADGFTDREAVELLYELYALLDEGYDMQHRHGRWRARQRPLHAAAAEG